MTYSKEQRKTYFSDLRKAWKKNKELAENDKKGKAKYDAVVAESPDLQISYYGFYFVYIQLKSLGLKGFPYIDAKTFNGWKNSGFIVKKGEKSKIDGLTWIKGGTKKGEDEKDDDRVSLYPKRYSLFHKTQVESI